MWKETTFDLISLSLEKNDKTWLHMEVSGKITQYSGPVQRYRRVKSREPWSSICIALGEQTFEISDLEIFTAGYPKLFKLNFTFIFWSFSFWPLISFLLNNFTFKIYLAVLF